MNAHPRMPKAPELKIKPSPKEYELQRFVVECLRFYATKGLIFYHCPNGEARSKRTGARLKAMGVRPGVGDICIVLPGGSAAFLELKTAKGRSSPEQRIFRADCQAIGARYDIAASPEQAVDVLLSWGALRSNPLRSAA